VLQKRVIDPSRNWSLLLRSTSASTAQHGPGEMTPCTLACLIGRTTGYVAATVIVDPRASEECDQTKPGIVCGAGVEQWPDAAAAQQRADYLKTVLSAAPILGTEYATLQGNLLLRVSGKLTPFVADQYKAAFTA